ncbi:cinnamoyl-CoA reductase 1-like [Amborella trichopoda]|uniref:cinnamoyl-CoA reductase 1-like n=1 Tax=Amborella trichopoda TaxID=13333 RepID=UPI0009BFABC5|nr:cinnamoyl-CoA reductase 1-like [Amborella trichopoda]|eukprot:XP_020526419.1 cinnamoyl-CoA reductase 1-like [Amborella trichopoda]
MGEKGSVCVTGAGTYVASWVVKLLLSKGYIVHGTVRDPDGFNDRKVHCQGVFHAASPLPSIEPKDFQKEMIDPAVMGTLNVLKASHEARIKRVVLMSSMAAIMINPNWPKGKPMDETSWSEITSCNTVQDWYCLSKTMGEREAWEYAGKTGVELVTVCPPLVLGPMLQKTINASTTYFIELLKGNL